MNFVQALPVSFRRRFKRALVVVWITSAILLVGGAVALAVLGKGVDFAIVHHRGWLVFGLAVVLSFVAEYVDSSIGMGYGTTLTPMLLLLGFAPLQIVPAVLLQELISGSLAAYSHHSLGNVDLRPGKTALKLGLLLGVCGLVGGSIAATVALELPKATIKVMTGIIVLAMGVLVALAGRMRLRFSWPRAGVLGLIAAANKGFMGGGYGPLITSGQVVSGVATREAIGITSLAEAFTCVGGLAGYLVGGTHIFWPLAGGMIVGGAIAAVLGAATVRAISPAKLTIAVSAGCVFLGVLTLMRALM